MTHHRLPAALLTITLFTVVTPVALAGVKTAPVAAVALILDGAATDAELTPELRRIRDDSIVRLRKNGFVILRSANPAELFAGDTLIADELAWLHIDLRAPDFTFNVVLLPPRWTKTKVGELRFVSDAGQEIANFTIKVPLSIRERDRRKHGIERLGEMLDELVPARGLKSRGDAMSRALLKLNDVDTVEADFLNLVKSLPQQDKLGDGTGLVVIATDPRLAGEPDLRVELLRQAVVAGGPRAETALGRALQRQVLAGDPDPELADLLTEALGLIGAAPGDALSDRVSDFSLIELLDLRRRFTFRRARAVVDQRIEALALAAVDQAPSFLAAEELAARIPFDALSPAARLRLRDSLYARISLADVELNYPRLVHLFPETEYPTHPDDHLERSFLDRARELTLTSASPLERLEFYREYLRCAPRGDNADLLVKLLAVDGLLEAELIGALSGATTSESEERALATVFGPNPGPRARVALSRALARSLGPAPADDAVLDLLRRHPDLDEARAIANQRGLVRDRATHAFPVKIGDLATTAERTMGVGGKLRDNLARRDLSPAALVASNQKIPNTGGHGLAVLEYKDRARFLIRDGQIVRLLIDESGGHFHHGIRTGDSRAELIRQLGEPTESRALMFGREVLRWAGFDGGAIALTVVVDRERASFLFEEDEAAVKSALAQIW